MNTDTYTDRLSRIRGDVPVHTVESGPMPEKPKCLGPNQLQWCRDTWAVFRTCERQAIDAEAHRQALRDAVRS